MTKIFNTTFEISMRLLLMLSVDKNRSRTIDNLVLADFITNYSKEFGLADTNLHGDNEFSFTEIAARRTNAREAIKSLVLDRLVIVQTGKDGFRYSISTQGLNLCKSLTSDYAQEYLSYARKVYGYMEGKSETELLAEIGKKSTAALRKE